MHTYNPVPVLDTSFSTPDDGDLATVASIIMMLDTADCIKFFTDQLDGTSDGVTLESPDITGTAQIEVANFSTGWSVASDKIVAVAAGLILNTGVAADFGGTLEVDGATTLHALLTGTTAHFTGAVDFDTTCNVDGATTLDELTVDEAAVFNSGVLFSGTAAVTYDACTAAFINSAAVTMASGSSITMAAGSTIDLIGALLLTTTGQIIERRGVQSTNANTTIAHDAYTYYVIPSGILSTTRTLTITNGTRVGEKIRIASQDGSNAMDLRNASTVPIGANVIDAGTMSAGQARWVDIVWNGTVWEIAGSDRF